jgi:hypothetical protein
MAEVLIVGAESPFLRILSVVFSQTWEVYQAHSESALQEVLSRVTPAVVLIEHTLPTDLQELNPRRFGFSGPVILLADEEPPPVVRQMLGADRFSGTSDLRELARLVNDFLKGR